MSSVEDYIAAMDARLNQGGGLYQQQSGSRALNDPNLLDHHPAGLLLDGPGAGLAVGPGEEVFGSPDAGYEEDEAGKGKPKKQTSEKRKAQNRVAQRNFRERKERQAKQNEIDLVNRNDDVGKLKRLIEAMARENHFLRGHITDPAVLTRLPPAPELSKLYANLSESSLDLTSAAEAPSRSPKRKRGETDPQQSPAAGVLSDLRGPDSGSAPARRVDATSGPGAPSHFVSPGSIHTLPPVTFDDVDALEAALPAAFAPFWAQQFPQQFPQASGFEPMPTVMDGDLVSHGRSESAGYGEGTSHQTPGTPPVQGRPALTHREAVEGRSLIKDRDAQKLQQAAVDDAEHAESHISPEAKAMTKEWVHGQGSSLESQLSAMPPELPDGANVRALLRGTQAWGKLLTHPLIGGLDLDELARAMQKRAKLYKGQPILTQNDLIVIWDSIPRRVEGKRLGFELGDDGRDEVELGD